MMLLTMIVWLATGDPGSPPSSAPAADALVQRSAEHYDRGEFDLALHDLKEAWALSGRISILYNIAQVQRMKGDCADAFASYGQFAEKSAPDDPDRDRALRRQEELRACANPAKPPVVAAPVTPQPLAASPVPEGPATAANPPLHLATRRAEPPVQGSIRERVFPHTLGFAVLGAAGVTAVAAVVLGVKAKQASDTLSVAPVYDQQADQVRSSGQRDQRWAIGLGAAALAAGAAGTLGLLLTRPPTSVGHPDLALTTGGGLVGWSGSY